MVFNSRYEEDETFWTKRHDRQFNILSLSKINIVLFESDFLKFNGILCYNH